MDCRYFAGAFRYPWSGDGAVFHGAKSGEVVMWFLVWFQVMNNNIEHYQLNQFTTENECREALEDAKVLITTSQTTVYCFEVIPK